MQRPDAGRFELFGSEVAAETQDPLASPVIIGPVAMLGFSIMEEPMKGKRFTEEQIIRVLQEADAGLSVADVCRKHNCAEQSFYRWKKKFGGMEVSEAKRLRELERENGELKKIVAEQTLDIRMLKDVNSKKW